ncbi:DUF397 domain-containing protein [Streptomyces genisteinicus]|uniref:DUF397 domain-containing protein n=1 Tax=Streptomyces genisteinicus TaxID=2768068 RepID=A0A7H0HPR1_9ACTN|nr:DUF397 domain-containing protein [Streptomyces genisteinicus]QNP62527.1 DUF397 domain-containing protein [Streptomyces genisteinicus]
MTVSRIGLGAVAWRTSSYSNTSGGDCVEVADGPRGVVPVRDSTRPGGPVVVVGGAAWAVFVDGLRAPGTTA